MCEVFHTLTPVPEQPGTAGNGAAERGGVEHAQGDGVGDFGRSHARSFLAGPLRRSSSAQSPKKGTGATEELFLCMRTDRRRKCLKSFHTTWTQSVVWRAAIR